jgi:hypothetical protein
LGSWVQKYKSMVTWPCCFWAFQQGRGVGEVLRSKERQGETGDTLYPSDSGLVSYFLTLHYDGG